MSQFNITIVECFRSIPDPRIERRRKHDLVELLVIAVCATLAGADGWEDMEAFGENWEDWLKRYLKLENGIPSHDTFRRVFERLDPEAFEKSFLKWLKGLREALSGHVAIDGKTLRRSFDRAKNQHPLHLVQALATETGLALGQVAVSGKENEIVVIPQLLELLMIKGCIVTIDAIGCQKKIASAIRKKDADYVLMLKENQPSFLKDVKDFFERELSLKGSEREFAIDCHETTEKHHGRIEVRQYAVCRDIEWLNRDKDWEGLCSIAMVTRQRTIGEKTTKETCYYISSLGAESQKIVTAIRSHWGIENSLHWVLDVTFNEDASRVRRDNAPRNLALLKKIALNLLRSEPSKGVSIRKKRKICGWRPDFLLGVITGNPKISQNQGF